MVANVQLHVGQTGIVMLVRNCIKKNEDKFLKIVNFTALIWMMTCSAVFAEEAEWRVLYNCSNSHISNVARVVESVDEGASLIVDVLCLNETTELINAMIVSRSQFVRQIDNIYEVHNSFMAVINREIRGRVYRAKLLQ